MKVEDKTFLHGASISEYWRLCPGRQQFPSHHLAQAEDSAWYLAPTALSCTRGHAEAAALMKGAAYLDLQQLPASAAAATCSDMNGWITCSLTAGRGECQEHPNLSFFQWHQRTNTDLWAKQAAIHKWRQNISMPASRSWQPALYKF